MSTKPWASSNRSASLPPDWPKRRARVKRRDGNRCVRCGSTTKLEVHHKGDRDDHRDHMLETLCHDCHQRETVQESIEARAAQPKARRPSEPHPGLLSHP